MTNGASRFPLPPASVFAERHYEFCTKGLLLLPLLLLLVLGQIITLPLIRCSCSQTHKSLLVRRRSFTRTAQPTGSFVQESN